LKLDLLGDIQSVIHLNSKISDCALQLRMAWEELHGAQVADLTIDLGSLCASHRNACRNIRRRFKADAFNPAMHQPGILPVDNVALREVDLGRDIGSQWSGALVTKLQRSSSTAP
jgi:hypothetical protein